MTHPLLLAVDFDPENPTAGQMSITDPRLYPSTRCWRSCAAVVIGLRLGGSLSRKKSAAKNAIITILRRRPGSAEQLRA